MNSDFCSWKRRLVEAERSKASATRVCRNFGVDRRFEINLRNGKSSHGTDDEEKDVNLFPAELLMREGMLKADTAQLWKWK